jgi:sugar/nucleoside kinase (ribokinase family)
LCLGEALVDMVGERQGATLAEMPCFSPHLGGVAANVALVAARAGAGIALAGGAGDDPWGRWLRSRLRTAGVDISLFELRPGEQTALAFVTVDGHGEPTYVLHGDGAGTIVPALEGRLESTVRRAAALVAAGAELVVVTLGAEGAILRGALEAAAPGVACRVVNTAGAGDVLTGTLLAALARDAFAPSAVAAALPEAVAAAARACGRWGAVE